MKRSVEIEGNDELDRIIVEKTDGMSFDQGYKIPQCINNFKKRTAISDGIAILITDRHIKNQTQVVPLMEEMIKAGMAKKLLIIADEFSGDALGMMAANCQQGAFHVIPVKAPRYGQHKIGILKDIAEATGAVFVSEEDSGARLEQATVESLGKVRKVVVEEKKTIIISEDSLETKKRVSDRIDFLKSSLEEEKSEEHRSYLKSRIATLTDGITVIKVGGSSNQERRELKFRVEDAVRALESSREEGVVPGCGSMHLKCIPTVDQCIAEMLDSDEVLGAKMLRKALTSPTNRILEVAGIPDRELLISKMQIKGYGYNFESGEIGDMFKLGVWDSAKSVRCTIQYAAACSSSFLTLGAAIAHNKDEEEITEHLKKLVKGSQA